MIKEIINKIKGPNPCSKESMCIVRPACHLLHSTPWKRTNECPDYINWKKRVETVDGVVDKTIDWFWIVAFLGMFIFTFVTFVLGIMKWIEILF